jgi:hypothetical protein
MSLVSVGSVKNKKEHQMIPHENKEPKNTLGRTNAIVEGLNKTVTELQSRVQKVSSIILVSFL